MKVKGFSNLDCPRTPHILLNIVFPIDLSYDFSLSGTFLSQSVLLAKIDYLLKKLTLQTHHSYLPFYCNSREKQFLKEILGRKSHCIMIRDKFRNLSAISHGAFELKKWTTKTYCLFYKKLHHRLGSKCTSDDDCSQILRKHFIKQKLFTC